MRIGIIGGGVAGLGAAYFLSRDGHQVEVFERAPELGGLAGSFDFDGIEVEKYYHFICRDDVDLLEMAQALGLGDEIEWQPGRMRFFCAGKLYRFEMPWDLLRFTPLSLVERIRFGLCVALSRKSGATADLDNITARDWLVAQIGEHAYQIVWEPLLRLKFGSDRDRVSASWICHRIHRVARSRRHLLAREDLGFLRRGTPVLLERLVEQLRRAEVGLHTATVVDSLTFHDGAASGLVVAGAERRFDALVSTAPLPILASLLGAEAAARLPGINSVRYSAVVCLILKLRRPLTDGFWINTHDPRVPFAGFIEYTNLNPRRDADSPHIAYVPFYLPPESERLTMSDEQIYRDCLEGLRVVVPEFGEYWVLGYRVFRDRYAQAVCTVGFGRALPPVASPIPRLYVTDSTQLYPSDRTISGMLGQAKRVAALIRNPALT